MEEGKEAKAVSTEVAPEKKTHAENAKKPNEAPRRHVYRYGVVPSHMICQYYMDREKELYERACKIKANIKANAHAKAIATDVIMASGASYNENRNDNNKSTDIQQKGNEQQINTQNAARKFSKITYRYTMQQMKDYNPYRYYYFVDF